MKINRNNYEAYIIDYLDGNLSREDIDTLMLFLEQNPDIKEEADGLEMTMPLKDENFVFPEKSSLRQPDNSTKNPVNRENYETWLIASVENDLNPAGQSQLDEFLEQNPGLKREHDLFISTRSTPDLAVSFEEKASLKNKSIKPVKGIEASNYEEMMIAHFEGDLTTSKTDLLNEFLNQNPGLKQEYEWLKKSGLSPDKNISYPEKSNLKKYTLSLSRRQVFRSVAAAATIALLIAFSWNMLFPPKVDTVKLTDLQRSDLEHKPPRIVKQEDNTTENKNRQNNETKVDQRENNTPESSRREDISGMNMIASSEPKQIKTENTPQLKPDYRIYIKDLYDVNANMYQDDHTMMAAIDKDQYPSLDELALKKIENWSGMDTLQSDKNNLLWIAINAGITGFNKLTGSDVQLQKKISDEGQLKSYSFKAGKLKISRSR